jgi:hypothetical protein
MLASDTFCCLKDTEGHASSQGSQHGRLELLCAVHVCMRSAGCLGDEMHRALIRNCHGLSLVVASCRPGTLYSQVRAGRSLTLRCVQVTVCCDASHCNSSAANAFSSTSAVIQAVNATRFLLATSCTAVRACLCAGSQSATRRPRLHGELSAGLQHTFCP